MPLEPGEIGLSPMMELELEQPWLKAQTKTEHHCVACDPGGDFDDRVEPPGGEAAFIDVDEPAPDLF